MQYRRVHTVNSAFAAILFDLSGKGWLRTFCFVAIATCSAPSQAQEIVDFPIQTLPNPFRDSMPFNAHSDSGRWLEGGSSNANQPFVDVIRLSSLPPNTERPVVTAISVSPNGNVIAAAGDDHVIRIINLESGKTIATLMGHTDWVQAVEFSPSGTTLASCSNDGSLRIWSNEQLPKLISEKIAGHALMSLTYLGDDSIFAAGFSNEIYRYDSLSKEFKVIHTCDCRDIRTVVASPDRTRIAFGGRDGVLRVLRVDLAGQGSLPVKEGSHRSASENEIAVPLHFERIRNLQFSADGNQITSVGEDRRIVHFDLVNRVTITKTEIEGGKLLGLCQLEPNLFAIGSSDNTIRIFSNTDQQVHAKLVGHDGSVSVLKRTQKHLISGSFDTTIRIWNIDQSIASIDKLGRYVHPVAAQFEDSGAANDIK